MGYLFSEIYLFRLHKMEPKDHVAGEVETEVSRFENWTSEIYSVFLLIPLIVLRSPQDSLHCHLQEKNSIMDLY